MPQTPEPTHQQLDLREDAWTAPGSIIRAWPTSIAPVWRAHLPSRPAMPECTCPSNCARDHEHE